MTSAVVTNGVAGHIANFDFAGRGREATVGTPALQRTAELLLRGGGLEGVHRWIRQAQGKPTRQVRFPGRSGAAAVQR